MRKNAVSISLEKQVLEQRPGIGILVMVQRLTKKIHEVTASQLEHIAFSLLFLMGAGITQHHTRLKSLQILLKKNHALIAKI